MLVLNRSPNLVIGALLAVFNVVVAFHFLGFSPTAEQIGVVNVAIGALVALIAGNDTLQQAAGRAASGRIANGNGAPPA